MRDLEKLEREYKEFIDRINEVNSRIEKVVDEDMEIKRFVKFTNDEKHEMYYVYTYYDLFDDDDFNYHSDFEVKDQVFISDEEYDKMVEESTRIRNELFEEKFKIMREFSTWKYKNDIKYSDFKETQRNYREHYPKWRGWDSSNHVYRTMIRSIESTDQDEINKLIDNMKKVIELTRESYINKDYINYFVDEYIDYLVIVNNETRFGENNYCMTTLALDLMENEGFYNSYRESFKEFVCNVCEEVDGYFNSMLWFNEREEHKQE